ncbi:MAG: MFS transporter [Candidatus Bathyarchaeota archaeon]|nr:MFS transporter [Candidatus Bathyarchaeota archaeon]
MALVLGVVRDVFSERNIVVLSGTSCLYRVFNSLWRLWWSLYLLDVLGAPIAVIGLLSTIQSSSQILFQLPGGLMADRIGRKKVIVLGTTLRILGPLVLVLAPTWQWVIPGVILNSLASLYMPAFNAIIADSLPYERRGAAFGAYRMVTSVPSIVMPIVSGVYIDAMGIAKGVRMGLYMYIVAAVAAMLARALFLRETLTRDGADGPRGGMRESLGLDLRGLLGKFRGTILFMLAVGCVSGFAMRMVYPFLVIYGVDVIGLKESQWGALQTIAMGITTGLYLLGGMLSDKFGRVPGILVARSLLPAQSLGLMAIHDFNRLIVLFTVLGVGAGFGGGGIRGGGGMGGPSWQALIADIIPSRDRGKVMGFMGTLTGLINLPAPILGAYIWEAIGPNTLLLSGGILGLISVPLILLFVRQPETRQR